MKASITPRRHVYVAVPLGLMNHETSTSPSHQKGVEEVIRRPSSKFYFLVGSVIGIGFSVLGFYVQDTFQFESIHWYSLGWSCFTSLAAYLMFYCCMREKSEMSEAPLNRQVLSLEYFFALGVFLGFCVACTAIDILLGMPVRSIVLTVTVAIMWALLMAYCGSVDGDDEDDVDNTITKPCTGTLLPIMIV